ncbi:MAG: tetratricopeptide repeat protein [Lamprocystis purpurea]|uniref:CheR family methyltransferase n=1 Tax=Lamprocystis purpurea TaxID=61598 RepID=UPI00036D3F8C|nr:protein-glutamate O-methyltransferase CheR [Lamprocystis purpurea]MBV5274696.1 tetratricopeptide repeat protein [Lamprocystis purpurea]
MSRGPRPPPAVDARPESPAGCVAEPLRDWIRTRTGISITDQNQAPVELAVRIEAERHGLDPARYLQRLLSGGLPPQAFIDAVATNESYFFRALEQMRVVVTRLIPERLARRPGQPVRILSLPCARGEEPFSLAILCEEHRIPPQSVQLVGGDISATCVADAGRGLYSPLALRRTDPELARRWFTPAGSRAWQLEPALLPRVELRRLNLLADAEVVLARRFDIVFCENLLIYFDAETTVDALAVLGRLLVPDGWLFVDHAEWNIPRGAFRMQEFDGCVGFRPPGAPAAGTSASGPRTGRVADAPSRGASTPSPTRIPAPLPTRASGPAASPVSRPLPRPARAAPAAPLRGSALTTHLAQAQVHYRAKRFAEALSAFDAVLTADPGHPLARLGKARVLADCGEDFEALEIAESLLHGAAAGGLKLAPADQVEALVLMGLLLHKKGLKDLAQGYLREVKRHDPHHPSLGLLRPHRPGDADA